MNLLKWQKDVFKDAKQLREKADLEELRIKQCEAELQSLGNDHSEIWRKIISERRLLEKICFVFFGDPFLGFTDFDIGARFSAQESTAGKKAFDELDWVLETAKTQRMWNGSSLALLRGERNGVVVDLVNLKKTHRTSDRSFLLQFYDIRVYRAFRKKSNLSVTVSGIDDTKKKLREHLKNLAGIDKMLRGKKEKPRG